MKKIIPAVVAVAAVATVFAFAVSNSDTKSKDSSDKNTTTNSDATTNSETTTDTSETTENNTIDTSAEETSTEIVTTENNSEEQPTQNTDTGSESVVTVVTVADGFSNRGFSHYKCETTGTYTFTVGGSESANWSVYILDEEYKDADKYISKEETISKALTNNGSVDVKEGQYIYIECSLNEFTDGTPETDSNYTFCIK